MSQPHALAWWSADELDSVAARVGQAWAQWHGAWLGALPPAPRARCANAHEAGLPAAGWQPLVETHGGSWIADAALARALLATELTGESEPVEGSVAAQLAARAWDAAVANLAALLPAGEKTSAAPDDRLLDPWSGAVGLELPLGRSSVTLLLDARCVAHLNPRLAPARAQLPGLDPLESVVRTVTARLSVELAECEIALGDLQGLAVGDVLRLDHDLARPLVLRMDGTALCSARLGRRGIAKAIALAPLHEA